MICGAFQQRLLAPSASLTTRYGYRPSPGRRAECATASPVSRARCSAQLLRSAASQNRDPCKTRRRTLCFATCRFALHSADTCATTGCAVYTIFRTTDAQGRNIDCERLLLPLGTGD